MKKLIVLISSLLVSNSVFAGFCDTAGAWHSIDYVFVFGSRAYITFDGTQFSKDNDAGQCSHHNQFAIDLNEENKSSIFPLLVSAFVANKPIRAMYCGGCVHHQYHSTDVTVPLVTSIVVKK